MKFVVTSKYLGMILFSLLVVFTLIPACGKKPSGLTDSDRANIYAAVIRQTYTIDHTFGAGNSPNFPVVYLPRATDDSAGDPNLSLGSSSWLSQSVQEAIMSVLHDLPAKFIWVDNRSEVPMDKDGVAGNGAIIYFGNIYLQKDGSVQVATGLFFASLGGGGTTYVLKLENNTWIITGDTGKHWIS